MTDAPPRPRRNPTLPGLVLALAASLGVVAFIVLLVVRPDAATQPHVDYASVAEDARPHVEFPLVSPVLPPGWWANRAGLESASDQQTWRVGFVTPSGGYIALYQSVSDERWLDDRVEGADPGRILDFDGPLPWTEYDRRDEPKPGNAAYALATQSGGSTIVLVGTAGDADFATLALAVAAELP